MTISGSQPDTTDLVKQSLQKFWGTQGNNKALSFLSSELCAGLAYLIDKQGRTCLDTLLLPKMFIEEKSDGSEVTRLIGTTSNDASLHRPSGLTADCVAFVLVIADPDKVPTSFPRGKDFTKTGSPAQIQKYVDTEPRKKRCIVAIRLSSPIPFGATIRRGTLGAEGIQSWGETLGDDVVAFIVDHLVQGFNREASEVLSNAYAAKTQDFLAFMPTLPADAQVRALPTLAPTDIDPEFDKPDPELDAIVGAHAKALRALTAANKPPPSQVDITTPATKKDPEHSDSEAENDGKAAKKAGKKKAASLAFLKMLGGSLEADSSNATKVIAQPGTLSVSRTRQASLHRASSSVPRANPASPARSRCNRRKWQPSLGGPFRARTFEQNR